MKRSSALVSYSSSSEEDNESNEPQTKKKKKLPSVSSSLTLSVPKDNPALHQGRTRTTPHVEGQWASHVYVSIKVERRSLLYNTVSSAFETAKELVPELHDFFGINGDGPRCLDLHVSLSRPIFLRTHQKDDLKRALRLLAEKSSRFKVSFSTFSVLTNDEQTRTFVALDVGSGHRELKNLSDGLTPFLSVLRQKEYYADPRFHASIAWALLGSAPAPPRFDSTPSSSLASAPNSTDSIDDEDLEVASSDATPSSKQQQTSNSIFKSVHRLPGTLIPLLNEKYASTLSSRSCGSFDVESVGLKIGNEVLSFKFGV